MPRLCSWAGRTPTTSRWARPALNPWRYVCPGTNNPGSYDLWIQLSIAGKNNLICNWSEQVQIGSPLP